MNYIEIIGVLAAIFTTVANIPQAVKVIRTRSTKSLSAITYSFLFIGMTLWVLYGIGLKDMPIIITNAIAGSLCGIILTLKLIELYKNRKTINKPSE
ncbi:hypothetical protein DVK85_01200 [Flavobacterium arcticum]|uniref:Glutathione synthetase n=1 Tax=Flavobacterium arcticum TaxID=1784713 RepID=A0A345H8K9_9FLAO|nr:SemiSWEET transporter [Flavobacterium arcticum]AXG72919.1 hypothetical protein DVK85_01200 [Flavobacterium arcticum]KAF2510416.1 hypothetical protein E0W72_08005 [Flavobacterium arcticum]